MSLNFREGVKTIKFLDSFKNENEVLKTSDYIKRLLCVAIFPVINIIYAILNKPRVGMHNVSIKIDDLIPFNSLFVIPYVIWFLYMAGSLLYFCFKDFEVYKKMFLSMVAGLAICYTIFFFFPTTTIRPAYLDTSSITGKIVNIIYHMDGPYNCFPSIHVMQTITIMLYTGARTKIRPLGKAIINIIGISIILSTMFIKQHYFLDAVSGAVISCALYFIININSFEFVINIKNKNKQKEV
jgi:membrane-associated phospholipid phosphatase